MSFYAQDSLPYSVLENACFTILDFVNEDNLADYMHVWITVFEEG